MVRAALKEPVKAKAKAREVIYYRQSLWKDGVPQKQGACLSRCPGRRPKREPCGALLAALMAACLALDSSGLAEGLPQTRTEALWCHGTRPLRVPSALDEIIS
jgi:hypothetical protein